MRSGLGRVAAEFIVAAWEEALGAVIALVVETEARRDDHHDPSFRHGDLGLT